MAIHVPKPSPGREPETMLDINTTPLIDVMLVLLVMLIITIPIQLHSVNLQLPTGAPPPRASEPDVVRVDVDAQSRVYWNGELVADRAALEQRIERAAAAQQQPELHLRPDRKAKYAAVAAILASAQRLGVARIGIVGSEQFVE
jgi:biopolymer transport protein ExbD